MKAKAQEMAKARPKSMTIAMTSKAVPIMKMIRAEKESTLLEVLESELLLQLREVLNTARRRLKMRVARKRTESSLS